VTADAGRLRADAQRNREQIVAAARTVFAESGSAVAMEEIARRAGVGIGTLYRRFPDRASLIRAVTMESVTALLAEAHAAQTADGTAWDALARLIHHSVDLGFSALLTMLGEESREELVADARFRELRGEFIAAVETLVTRAQREGTMRADVGAGDVFAMVALLLRKVVGGPAELTDMLTRRCVALTLDGLRAGPHGTLPGHAISTHDVSY
jgi:AcrR family transcriptional regulator